MAVEFRLPDIFGRYLRHADINDYLDHLAVKYPDSVLVQTCGRTYEGRELKSIRITQQPQVMVTPSIVPRAPTPSNSGTTAAVAAIRSGARSATQSQSSTKSRRRSLGKRKSCSAKSLRSTSSKNTATTIAEAPPPAPAAVRRASAKPLRIKKSDSGLTTIPRGTSAPPPRPPPKRPVVLIDGGIHAREWISVATALYCVHQLTDNGHANRELLGKLDFVVVPVVNADGYEYTHTHVSMVED